MRRAVLLSGVLLSSLAAAVAAQVPQPADPAQPSFGGDAPKVAIWIEGAPAFEFGSPVRVHLQVSDDAYVVAGHVSTDGRLTIIFPTSPTGRTFVRGNTDILLRGRMTPAFSFYANELQGEGYVFAIASYSPLDVTQFKFADFERWGFMSDAADFPGPFQMAVGGMVWRPESMIERLASWTLFDNQTPFDYDYDFYTVSMPIYADYGSFDSCFSSVIPFVATCGNSFNTSFYCLVYGACTSQYPPLILTGGGVRVPGGTSGTPSGGLNTKVLLGGLERPDTVSRVATHDPRTGANRPPGMPGGTAPPRSQVEGTTGHFYSVPGHTITSMHQATVDILRKRNGNQGTNTGRAWVQSDPTSPNASSAGNGAITPAPRGFEAAPNAGTPRTGGGYRSSANVDPRRGASSSEQPRAATLPRSSAPVRESPRGIAPSRVEPRAPAPARDAPRAAPPRASATPRASAPPRASGPPRESHASPPPSRPAPAVERTPPPSSSNPKKP